MADRIRSEAKTTEAKKHNLVFHLSGNSGDGGHLTVMRHLMRYLVKPVLVGAVSKTAIKN